MVKLWVFVDLAVIYIIRIVLGFLLGVYLLDGTTSRLINGERKQKNL